MMRRSFLSLAAAATATTTAASGNAKMNALYKILTGETHFKNKTPVKVCNIVHQFGEKWEEEMAAYSKTLSAEQKKLIERQVERVKLTRYTVAELAAYCGDGPAFLDAAAQEANIEQGVEFLKQKGVEEFDKYVAQEAANANWKPEEAKKFADAVKAKAKAK
ncbi:uncharacterized protein TM35_000081820 [Trypanosoma theileri]|uniref:Uncharacterized protein n=1 Tax=Trypanosoma theileri TaxID=67003 RepID=A0A1X0P0A8_9TRYP|nr:uncharacterized protein TM35_000081820 [Trypanosoma theileri]ORC90384.1 hypothetical protein TM35_000081820 [Trypanosoma theileri]